MPTRPHQLINTLLADPARFDDSGCANELLQHYTEGFSISTLAPLLGHHNSLVRRSAAYIASELGIRVESLVQDIVNLASDDDLHTQCYALESLMACSVTHTCTDAFIYVLRAFESDVPAIRWRAMRLVAYANDSQIRTGQRLCELLAPNGRSHHVGLVALEHVRELSRYNVISMLHGSDCIVRKYGAIAAKLKADSDESLLVEAMGSNDDDVRRFGLDALADQPARPQR